jgi:3-dehydroquinate synthase
METLGVALGERSYPIHIGAGLLGRAELYRPYLGGGSAAIVTNEVVAPLYLPKVREALKGVRLTEIVVSDGEQTKSWKVLESVFDACSRRCGRHAARRPGRQGRVTSRLCRRRLSARHPVPTGSDHAARTGRFVGQRQDRDPPPARQEHGQRLHQPLAVISTSRRSSRPRGARGSLKWSSTLALDLAFIEWLEANIQKLLQRDREALIYGIRRCCELKARIVAADEREAGVRALLNFGHTFGHAIEAGMGYGAWLHGEAIAAGMVMAAELSSGLNLIGKAEVARVRKLVKAAGLPIAGPGLPPERLMELMAGDKKAAQGKLRFVVLEALGRAALRGGVDDERVRQAIVAAAQ